MIQRHWRATARPGRVAEYLDHLRAETFPALSRIPAFLRAVVATRPAGAGVRVLVVTEWDSMTAIEAFAGDAPSRAVVPSTVQAMMIEYDDRVEHYEVVAVHPGSGEAPPRPAGEAR